MPSPTQYIEELWKKKQSDVLRFLLRVRCWVGARARARTCVQAHACERASARPILLPPPATRSDPA